MKPVKLLLLLVVVLLAWFAWRNLPGLRTQVSEAVDDYGGWTEEARHADPVGFIEYAEKKLGKDIAAFRASREKLAQTQAEAEVEKQRHETLLLAADELAEIFRDGYRMAEETGAWPIELEGASYTREALVEQVESILGEGATYRKVVGIYGEVIESAEKQRKLLRDRIQSTEATLVELRAQKELVRVDELTAEADELLAQVDALLGGNTAALGDEEPVRSVEDLLAAAQKPERSEALGPDVLEFLKAE